VEATYTYIVHRFRHLNPYKAATRPNPPITRGPARPAAAGASVPPAAIFFLAVAVADAIVVFVAVAVSGAVFFAASVVIADTPGVAVAVAAPAVGWLVAYVDEHVPPVKTGLSLATAASGGKRPIRADTTATGPVVRELRTEFPALGTQLCASGNRVAAQLGILPAAYTHKASLAVTPAARLVPDGTREEILGGGVGKMLIAKMPARGWMSMFLISGPE
jgi:hypothetical protein